MTWEGWAASVLALLVGLGVGYLLGYVTASGGKQAAADKAIDAADKAADSAREQIDADTRAKLEQTDTAGGKDLVDALNDDYAAALPGGVRTPAPAADTIGTAGKPAGK